MKQDTFESEQTVSNRHDHGATQATEIENHFNDQICSIFLMNAALNDHTETPLHQKPNFLIHTGHTKSQSPLGVPLNACLSPAPSLPLSQLPTPSGTVTFWPWNLRSHQGKASYNVPCHAVLPGHRIQLQNSMVPMTRKWGFVSILSNGSWGILFQPVKQDLNSMSRHSMYSVSPRAGHGATARQTLLPEVDEEMEETKGPLLEADK